MKHVSLKSWLITITRLSITINVFSFKASMYVLSIRNYNNEEHIVSIVLKVCINKCNSHSMFILSSTAGLHAYLHWCVDAREEDTEIILDGTPKRDREGDENTEREHISKTGWEDYPVGGLSPFLLGWHHWFGGHSPAPEHFVVMYGDIRLLWQGPVETSCQHAFITQCDVGDTKIGWAGRGRWIWRQNNNKKQHC